MRRMITVALVAFSLVALAMPAATAKTVSNTNDSVVIVEGGWSSGEWGDEEVSWGFAGAQLYKGKKVGELYFFENHGTLTWCPADPDDPDDDYLGYEWTSRDGWGPVTVDVGKSYTTGSAVGTAEVWTYTYSDCDWWGEAAALAAPNNGGGEPVETVEIIIVMTGAGPLVKESGKYSFHIPGEYNEHGSNRSTYREATGEVTVDGMVMLADWGRIGQYVWKSHVNIK